MMKRLIAMGLLILMSGGLIVASEKGRFSIRRLPKTFSFRRNRDKKKTLQKALRERDQEAVKKLVKKIGSNIGRKDWDYLLIRTASEGWLDILEMLLSLHKRYPDQFSLDVAADDGELYNAPIFYAYKYKKPHVAFKLLPILLREGIISLSTLNKMIKWLDGFGPGLNINILKIWRDAAYDCVQEAINKRKRFRSYSIKKGRGGMRRWSEKKILPGELVEDGELPSYKELNWRKRFRTFTKEQKGVVSNEMTAKKLEELKKVHKFLSDEVERLIEEQIEWFKKGLEERDEELGG